MPKNLLKPIGDNEKTVSAIVQERIREAILSNVLPAGSRIDQSGLAADLNVSLVPVREALKALEAEGFVQIVPRRGAFVTKTSLDDMEDLYFAREVLEGGAAYHAAPKLTDKDLALLDDLMGKMAQTLDEHNFNRFSEYNRQFHFAIYAAAGSEHLMGAITNLWELAERYRYRYLFIKERGATIQQEHERIREACHARNPTRLRDAIIDHMRHTLLGIKANLVNPGE